MTQCKYTFNPELVKEKLNAHILIANRMLLEDIHSRSQNITPLNKTAKLRTHVTKKVSGKEAIITWEEPYASYQNRGERWDGSHKIHHWTTPGTGPNFAPTAVKRGIQHLQEIYDKLI